MRIEKDSVEIKVEKIETATVYNITGLTENEYLALKVLLNMGRDSLKNTLKENRLYITINIPDEEEVFEACKNITRAVWGLSSY